MACSPGISVAIVEGFDMDTQEQEPKLTECKNCGKKFSGGSENNPDFCSDVCNYDYYADQLEQ